MHCSEAKRRQDNRFNKYYESYIQYVYDHSEGQNYDRIESIK